MMTLFAAPERAIVLGFGLDDQVASALDLKTMLLFPSIDRAEGGKYVGAGFGVQFRIGD